MLELLVLILLCASLIFWPWYVAVGIFVGGVLLWPLFGIVGVVLVAAIVILVHVSVADEGPGRG